MQSRCSKYPCQIILYRGAFRKCIWMLKVVTEINAFPLSTSQLNESHNVSSCSQLLVSMGYIIHVTLKTNYCSAVHLKP